MRLNKFSVTINTTGGDGAATGSGEVPISIVGYIEYVHFDYHASAPASTDVVLSDIDHGTIHTESNNAAGVTRYPRQAGDKYLVDGPVTVTVAQSNALTGAVTVTVAVVLESFLSVDSVGLSDYANVVVVDPAGNGDYTTQAAAAAAITDDDASHVYNVFVFGDLVNWAVWSNRPYIRVHGNTTNDQFSLAGTLAARPSPDPAQIGRFFMDEPQGILARDNGTAWITTLQCAGLDSMESPSSADITTAFETQTGHEPINGSIAVYVDDADSLQRVVICLPGQTWATLATDPVPIP